MYVDHYVCMLHIAHAMHALHVESWLVRSSSRPSRPSRTIAQSASIERAMHVHVVVHAAFHVLHVMAM